MLFDFVKLVKIRLGPKINYFNIKFPFFGIGLTLPPFHRNAQVVIPDQNDFIETRIQLIYYTLS